MELTDQDLFLFNEGTHRRLWETLGAHVVKGGTMFRVWAPSAEAVSVVGDWNGWNRDSHYMHPVRSSGIWELLIPNVGAGAVYKYHVRGKHDGFRVDKADPVGFWHETPPKTGSVVASLDYTWHDAAWMKSRGERFALDAPVSIYEVHMGSWKRVPGEGDRALGAREFGAQLGRHCKELGFTHIELMPITEHPFYGSWGYQVSGYFAPTSRYGTPQDFMAMVDELHQLGIGVILDWVPAHFPTDEHGLAYFDGTHLYEHSDPRRGFHPDWKSAIFNYGRHEVRAFLISSALFWLEKYHLDGLRVDGVASMLYLDYSRKEGEWVPNPQGGRENLDAIHFLRAMNEAVYSTHPGVQTVAEESTAWANVSRPTSMGGLGFGYKWDMGWMHDTLKYFEHDPVHRRFHHNQITFRMLYAFTENYALPLSHDEVVHGKGSLLSKMPGDRWQKFANLRLLLAYMYAQPGKKLLFMGTELAPWDEWQHDKSLDWHLHGENEHGGMRGLITRLNELYKSTPALHRGDVTHEGFEWIDASDGDASVMVFMRKAHGVPPVVAAFNFTPVPRPSYRIGLPQGGTWRELFNSDAKEYGGSGIGNLGAVHAQEVSMHGRPFSVELVLPPLGAVFITPG